MNKILFTFFAFCFFLSSNAIAIADDVNAAKKNFLSHFTNSLATSMENIIGRQVIPKFKQRVSLSLEPRINI